MHFKLTAALSLALLLAGCDTVGRFQTPGTPGATVGQPTGEVIGTGAIRVALLVPQSAGGNGAGVANVFKNAARLGLKDFPNADIRLLVKDTAGTAEGAAAATQQALSEGAELVLGPVFSHSVSAAAGVARPAGVPIIGFSSDVGAASRGAYLLSFLPQDDVRRIVGYAADNGRTAMAAMFPDTNYGAVVEAAFRQEAARRSIRIISIQKYSPTPEDIGAKAKEIGQFANRVDSIFFPGDPQAAVFISQTLVANGVDPGQVKFLGSGQWDNQAVQREPNLLGAWYPAPARTDFDSFAGRYQAEFGTRPPRNATLAYDAVRLAAGLVREAGPRRFSTGAITSPDGFLGVDGIFRFRTNGTNERGLAVYEVGSGSARIVAPARRSFGS
ncbi:MAG: penicillin-binding protein activator [Pseudomonadota bacterium]